MQYFQEVGKEEQTVSKQDYLQQRRKLNPEVFKLLNRKYLRDFYRGDEGTLWEGHMVLAVDGSRAEIPNSRENRREYGESENRYGKGVGRANVSGVYDVYKGFLPDLGIHHYTSNEIQEAKEHIPAIKEIVGERPEYSPAGVAGVAGCPVYRPSPGNGAGAGRPALAVQEFKQTHMAPATLEWRRYPCVHPVSFCPPTKSRVVSQAPALFPRRL